MHWSTSDQNYAADIRIGFINQGDYAGNWSAVGTDSRDSTVEGGAPNQGSMNFGGFDQQLPVDWAGTVLHEFGHALGFEHEHQSPSGGCDFRLARNDRVLWCNERHSTITGIARSRAGRCYRCGRGVWGYI
jgi:hypothetical protein